MHTLFIIMLVCLTSLLLWFLPLVGVPHPRPNLLYLRSFPLIGFPINIRPLFLRITRSRRFRRFLTTTFRDRVTDSIDLAAIDVSSEGQTTLEIVILKCVKIVNRPEECVTNIIIMSKGFSKKMNIGKLEKLLPYRSPCKEMMILRVEQSSIIHCF